jgi:RsiW-degrading membrane proteinase PrsW (M82 family)
MKDPTKKKPPPGIGQKFGEWIGLEALQDFKLADIFSEVLKKHPAAEIEEQLITGTAKHTPSLEELKVGWARPWLFARLLAGSAALAFLLYYGYAWFGNSNLVPALLFVGSFAVPVSTLLFFLELNVPRNVSIFSLIQLLFLGGIASLIVALVFFDWLDFFSFLGASAAGIIEESAKLLIVALLMGKTGRYPWILNGLLFGAAIGCGFSAFENAGYAFGDIETKGMGVGVATIMSRGLLSPCMHILWTANAAAAFWIIRKDKPFSREMLRAPAFLKIFASSIILHMLWNAPFRLMPMPILLDLKYLMLGMIGWIICLRLVQAGLKQLNEARQRLAEATGASNYADTAS